MIDRPLPSSPDSDSRHSEDEQDLTDVKAKGSYACGTCGEALGAGDGAKRTRGQRKKRRNRRQSRKRGRSPTPHIHVSGRPPAPIGGTICFVRLLSTVAANLPFLSLPRNAAVRQEGPDDGRTHEVFVVITQHDGVARSGNNGGLWGSILRVAYDFEVKFDDTCGIGHAWSPFVEQLMSAFTFSGPYSV